LRIESTLDQDIVDAWLEAAKDLDIRVTAPFSIATESGGVETYEALIHDFGRPKGTLTGKIAGYRGDPTETRSKTGYFASNLSDSYRKYDREFFIATLNDWQWFGERERQPSWYTGKSWS
jgi:hypothetical protein